MCKADKAKALFEKGYNCAQAVFAAFAEEMGMDESTALKLSSSFGGGMGGLREVCGAVSGMMMVLGALDGYDSPDDHEQKKAHYAKLQALAAQMKDEHGSIICRELLQMQSLTPSNVPQKRDDTYYKVRPCAKYVAYCANLTEQALLSE